MLRSPRVLFSLAVLVFFVLVAIFAPRIASVHPTRMDYNIQSYLPPIWMRPDSSVQGYWLGADRWGRDIFSRLVYGSRTSIFLVLTAAPLAALLGTLVGVTAGYAGGRFENFLMRLTDIFSAFPAIMFSVLMVMVLRNQPLGQALTVY